MEPIEIIGAPQSVFVRAIRIAFEEKGVGYSLTPARPGSAQVKAIHPYGKIPVMRHGSFTLFESKAIATYIDRAFQGPALVPEDAKHAAVVEQWVSTLNSIIFPSSVIYMQANAFPKGPNGARDEALISETFPLVAHHMSVLNGAVSSGFFAGNAFSLADVYLLPLLAYLRTFPESGELCLKSNNLTQYFATHASRESFVRTTPPPLAELPR